MGGESFDVVVTGIEGAAGSGQAFAQRLAPIAGVTPATIGIGLQRGELTVRRRVDASAAEQLANDVRRLGAKVEIRPAEESLEFEEIEPDPENDGLQGTKNPLLPAGGNVAAIAPPPLFAGSGKIKVPPGRSSTDDPSRPQGRSTSGPERPFGADGKRKRARTPQRPSPRQAKPPRTPRVELAQPEPAASLAPARDLNQEFLLSLEAAANADAPVVLLDGSVEEAAPASLEVEPQVQEPAAREIKEQPAQRVLDLDEDLASGAQSSVSRPVPAQRPLSLELPQQQQQAQPPVSGPMASQSASYPAAPYAAGQSATGGFAGHSGVFGDDEPRRLLTQDPVANILFAVAAALLLGTIVGFAVQRSMYRSDIAGFEQQAQAAYENPKDVEQGDLPSVDELSTELDIVYGKATRSVFISLAIAAAVGVGVGVIKR